MLDDEVDTDAFAPLAGQGVWADVTPLPLVRARVPRSHRALADAWRARACSRQVDDAGAVCQPSPLTPQWKVRLRCRPLCCSPQPPHAASGRQEAHAYFRAVRASGEVSPRARALTALLVALNPADYTAWAWRYRCVAAAAAEEAASAAADAPDGAASSAGAWSACAAQMSRRGMLFAVMLR